MSRRFLLALGIGALFGTSLSFAQDSPSDVNGPASEDAKKVEFFEKKIRPLLVENCYTCHSASTNARGGLRLDERRAILAGGARGHAIIPSKPGDSLLLKSVRYEGNAPKMPPDDRLSDAEIADLERWISEGAVWPVETINAEEISADHSWYKDLLEEHWAWQPLTRPPVPATRRSDWAKSDVDRFILSKLETENLQPAAPASKESLIRRVTFDLTGLPPTPQEIDQFVADHSLEAYEKVVDRLLANPAFGEHWGRHWLDVARYGESTGSSRNVPYPHAWRYRDYVIDSFQKDKPYDQFLREQIAGDLLPHQSQEQRDEQLIATGFLSLGVKDVNQRFKNRFILDNIDEQIDTVSQSVLALTVSCARCHDHKFDPIPTADYYALVGIFQSTDLCAGVRSKMGGGGLDYYDTSMLLKLGPADVVHGPPAEELQDLQNRLDKARAEFQRLQRAPEGDEKAPNGRPKRQVARQKMNRLQQEMTALTDPAASGPVALGARDSQVIADAEIRVRGEAEKYGPIVPRGFLSLFELQGVPAIPADHSGRLELAQWLTHADNPLTKRVIVNRIWSHLFGAGLVASVDNFGVNGDEPTHPELLDYLAQRFVDQGWSIKATIRELLLSQTYQQSASADSLAQAVDPANRWHWRHSPRRLTAEEIRDAMLVSSGQLVLGRSQQSPAAELKVMEMRNNGVEARQIESKGRESRARSVYLPLVRGIVPTSLNVFDFAEQGMVTGHRDETTVAPQALYLLNDPLVREQAQDLAIHILQQHSTDPERILNAYRVVLGRIPTDEEQTRIQQYIDNIQLVTSELQPVAMADTRSDVASDSEETSSSTEAESTKSPPKPEIIDPDQADQSDAPIVEKQLKQVDAETAAWASFVQALYGAAEFRYLK